MVRISVFAAASYAALGWMLGGGAVAQTCKPIEFPRGATETVVFGFAPANDVVCYTLATGEGQTAFLKVLEGRNTIFSIGGMVDAQGEYSFTTERGAYRIFVGQLYRAAGPEEFRLLARVTGGSSGGGGQKAARDGGFWIFQHGTDGSSAQISSLASDGVARLRFACSPDRLGRLYFWFWEYRGGGLARRDGAGEPAMIEIRGRRGVERFPIDLTYSAADRAWLAQDFPPVEFLDALADGYLLVLLNGDGATVATAGLDGTSIGREALARVCRI